jgi:hypothetical protein
MVVFGVAVNAERFFEMLDRVARPALSERELAEPFEGTPTVGGRASLVQRVVIKPPGELEVVEAEGNLGLDQAGRRLDGRSSGEVVLRDSESPSKLAEELERGNSVARLDA